MEALNFFLEVIDVLINNLECLGGLLAVLDLDLYEHAPLLGLECKLLGLIKSVLLLPAHFDGGCNIENGILSTALRGFLDKLGYLFGLLSLHIAVKQKSCIVFVVVSQRVQVRLMPLRAR